MNHILVAVDGETGSERVLAAAVERAEVEGRSLVVLYAMPEGRYEARNRAAAGVERLGYGSVYGIAEARDDARDVAERLAAGAVGSRGVDYTAVGAVGTLVPTADAVAAEYGCGTVVLAESGSRLGRLFGRADRRFARGFGGTVVRVPRAGRSRVGRERSPVGA